MTVVHRPLTLLTAVAVRDPRGVVHAIGGFVAALRIVGPACVPYMGDGPMGSGWWRQDDGELLGLEAAITCLWCVACHH